MNFQSAQRPTNFFKNYVFITSSLAIAFALADVSNHKSSVIVARLDEINGS